MSAAPTPVLGPVKPSLRGNMIREESGVVCRGAWAMRDEDHGDPERTSDFELSLADKGVIASDVSTRAFPVDGNYSGWFKVRKNPPESGPPTIVQDNVTIKFQLSSESGVDGDLSKYSVAGEGSNNFGNFTLKGFLEASTGAILMYREYIIRPIKGGGVKRERSGESIGISREGAGRVRKASTLITEYEVLTNQALTGKEKASSSAGGKQMSKVQKTVISMQKCGSILNEMSKYPAAMFFAEPVDPIKLNIPEYPLIVAVPMDFSTIRANLGNSVYQTPIEFADHVRLVFKNAMAFNQLKDNPVYVAAKDLLSRFEDKYRNAVAQLNGGSSSGSKKVSSKKKPVLSLQNAQLAQLQNAQMRQQQAALKAMSTGSLPPDGSMVQMQEMQRKMMEMQNELFSLRNTVAPGTIDTTPLTNQEKKELVQQIHKLPSVYIEKIVTIIQEGEPNKRPEDDGTDEVEISLDELDVYTLRNLQHYVDSVKQRGKGGNKQMQMSLG